MNSVPLYQQSTAAMNLSSSDKLLHDLVSIVDDDRWFDIQVKVQGKLFPCHKNILAARSSYFNQKLERYLTQIVEEDGNADAFDLVRRYIYKGTFTDEEADQELMANVLSLSIKYKLEELTNFVSDRMKERITTENAVKVFRLMTDLRINSIAEDCLEFIEVHGDDCLQSGSYIDLNLDQLVRLVKNVTLGDTTQLTVIRKWSRRHRDVHAAKLFDKLDGERNDGQIDRAYEKQYILLKSDKGEMVILDAVTFDCVSQQHEPTTKECQIAVCQDMLYVINLHEGEIKSTPVSGLLRSKSIQWDKCAVFQSSGWIPGHVAVSGSVIYFMDKSYFWKFDTNSKTVTRSCEWLGWDYFLLEANDLVYAYRYNALYVTKGWTEIVFPSSLGQYPYNCSLIKMHDTVCLVGGRRSGAYLSRVLCYDTKWKVWTEGKPIKQARSHAATVSLSAGKTLLVGGLAGGEWMETIELFDEKTNQWNLIDYKVKLEWPQAVSFYA